MAISIKDKDGKTLNSQETLAKGISRLSQILLEIELYVLWIVGHFPVSAIRTLIYRLSGIKISRGSIINMGARIYFPENISIGEDTIVGEGAVLDGRAPLTIGNHVDIASQVMIYNSEHDINDAEFRAVEDAVAIGDYVFIGPRAIILPGVKIGNGAVIGAGAVVTANVGDFEIAGGVPAKKIGQRNLKDPSYRIRRKGIFDLF